MAIRKILYIPDPRLRAPTKAVETFDTELQTLIDDMFETMYDANGVGLAAPQIGISLKLAVIDSTRDKSENLVLINPEILSREGEEEMMEGCLSVPSAYDTVRRATKVRFKALDREGKSYEMTAEGLLAEVVQHECEHLEGVLYIDQLSALKKQRARKKVDKYKRMIKHGN